MGEMTPIGYEVSKVIKEEGVEAGFGVAGSYHTEYFLSMLPRLGVKTYTLRHEQSGPYAADGYSGCSRKVTCSWGTAGPGVTNALSGVAQAYTNMRPMVFFAGRHGASVNKHWSLQESYPHEIFPSVCKYVVNITDGRTAPHEVRRAFKIAKEPPQGPAVVVCSPLEAGWVVDKDTFLFYDIPREKIADFPHAAGDPQLIEKAVDRILKAERPFMLCGDGAFWSDADAELKEFCELMQIPVAGRRTMRGFIPETDANILSVGPMEGRLDVKR
jgi:acetolactate synthase-1/2/3 large subunit